MTSTGVIWMLHGVEPDSSRTGASKLYRNVTVPPDRLEALISEARSLGCEFVSMARFLSDKADGKPHRDILITIDDGLRNVYTEAFPLFRRLGVPFAFFIATGLIQHGFEHCRNAEMDGIAIISDHVAQYGGDFNRLFRRFRHLRRFLPFLPGRTVMRLVLGHGVDFDRYRAETICTPQQLRELAESGICEIGSHTVNHVHVDRVRGVGRELLESKRQLEEWTGRACEYFSYPYGHLDERSLALVRRNFRAATRDVVAIPAPAVHTDDDECRLTRVICTRESTMSTLLPIEWQVSRRLGVQVERIVAFESECASPVYRAEAENDERYFVKVVEKEAAQRNLDFLRNAEGCDFLPKALFAEPLSDSGKSLLCLEWMEGERRNAEDFDDAELAEFLRGCTALSEALGRFGGKVERKDYDDPDHQYEQVTEYCRRHRLVGRLLRPLMGIPEGERSYRGRRLTAIHGDMQEKNYGFRDGRFAAVYDFDSITMGLACEDAAYAFAERARSSTVSGEKRRRLLELFVRMVRNSPWQAGEWKVAVNHARLRIAARRVAKHPGSVLTALDVARRDRLVRCLAEVLEGREEC